MAMNLPAVDDPAESTLEQDGRFHLFEYKDKRFLFHVDSLHVFEIDQTAYDVLSLQSSVPRHEIATRLAEKHDPEVLNSVIAEWGKLEPALAAQAEAPESERSIRRYIARLLRKKSANITLMISQSCNLGCKYCYGEGGSFGMAEGLMSEDVALRSVDYLMEQTEGLDQVGIIFFGGEPLMAFDLMRKVVEYSQDRGRALGRKVSYSMTTNATLLTEEVADFIQQYRFGLKVSMDGPRSVEDRLRPFRSGRSSYETTERNVRMLLTKRRGLSARPTLTHQNLAIGERVRFFEQIGFTRVGFGLAAGTAFQKGPYDLTAEDLEKVRREDDQAADAIFERLSQGKRVIYNPFEQLVQEIHSRRKTRIRCGLGRGCRTVAVDGALYPCHRFVGMENYRMGDVYEGRDNEKLFDINLDYYRTKQACSDCWARHLCGGACPWYVAHDDGTFKDPDENHCNNMRAMLEQAMWFYCQLQKRFPEYLESLVGQD